MSGISGDGIEQAVLTSTPGLGFPKDYHFPVGVWKKDDATVLTGASAPASVAFLTSDEVIQWAANAAVTIRAAVKFTMPFDYAVRPTFPGRGDAQVDTNAQGDDNLVFMGYFRRQRAAADSATDFTPRCTVIWWTPGVSTALNTLTTNPAGVQVDSNHKLSTTAYVPTIAASNAADLVGWGLMACDIGARLRAEGKRIQPGDEVRLIVGPDAVNANAALQMGGSWLRYRSHMHFRNMAQRRILIPS